MTATPRVEYAVKSEHNYTAHVDGVYAGRISIDDAKNAVRVLSVKPRFQWQGVGIGLIRFAIAQRGRKLTPTPNKSSAARALSAKHAAEILE